jgi:uncharacterized protein YigA (DUF484 family)
MRKNPKFFTPFIVVLVLGSAGMVHANNKDDINIETPEIMAKLFDCREIADATDRLACFDREVGTVYEAQASKELVIADREQIKETKKGLFGFTLPKIGIFGGGEDDEDEVSSVTMAIASQRQMANGRYIFTMEDGARWMQTDNTTVLREPQSGDEVEIKKASMGSYMAKIKGSRAFRVRRVD